MMKYSLLLCFLIPTCMGIRHSFNVTSSPFDEHLDERIYSLYDPSDPFPLDPFTALLMVSYCCPQTKFAKVMFSQVSVCPRGGGVCPIARWDTPPTRGRHPPGSRRLPGSRHPPATDTPCTVHAGRWGKQAGGTHPTGMHSCSILFLILIGFFTNTQH